MPTRFRDLLNTNLPILNNSKNKHLMCYNASLNKFEIISSDVIVSSAATSISDSFVTQVEQEINVNNITFAGIDAGTF